MQLHQISSGNKQKTKKRVGRGGKLGSFSGHGVKGQKSRAGHKMRPAWRDLVKQIPKKRGYRFKPVAGSPVVINLSLLDVNFKEGEIVTAATLLEKGIISKMAGRMPELKILGDGGLKKKLSFKGLEMSKGAREKIVKAGGNII